jgi:response regulator RpfG family c-di-GMP phosphodiesterase
MTAHHTVLVVDDEPQMIALLRRTLDDPDYRVLAAGDGEAALRCLEQEPVDLMISDIDMPGMTGVELVARVRQQWPATARWLLTGDASLSTALDAINRGEVQRYFVKPWNPSALRAEVRQAIDRIGELRRIAAADQSLERRARMLEELEREHPGISLVNRDDGVYRLDVSRLSRLVMRVPVLGDALVDDTWAADDSLPKPMR